MATRYRFVVSLLLLMVSGQGHAWQTGDSIPAISSAHTDFIYTDNKKIYQDIYIQSEADKKVNLSVACYRYGNSSDSSLIFRHASLQKIKAGAKKLTIGFQVDIPIKMTPKPSLRT